MQCQECGQNFPSQIEFDNHLVIEDAYGPDMSYVGEDYFNEL
jgi:hypothetical protein